MEDFPSLKFLLLIFFLAVFILSLPFLAPQPIISPKTKIISNELDLPFPAEKLNKKQKLPQISARSALVLNILTKNILFTKNPSLRFSPASATKIMTAYVVLNHYPLDKTLIVDSERIIGSNMRLVSGERISVENLLYGLLLPSGNDAAYTLAQNYPASPAGGSGLKNFIDQMNKSASLLGLKNTHFSDPAGLSDDENFTTALDLVNLALAALENPTFKKIVATREKAVFDTTGRIVHNLENLNRLLWDIPGVAGVKTGFTDRAGGVLTTYILGEKPLLIVVFKSQDRFADTKALIDWALGQSNREK